MPWRRFNTALAGQGDHLELEDLEPGIGDSDTQAADLLAGLEAVLLMSALADGDQELSLLVADLAVDPEQVSEEGASSQVEKSNGPCIGWPAARHRPPFCSRSGGGRVRGVGASRLLTDELRRLEARALAGSWAGAIQRLRWLGAIRALLAD